MAAFVRHPSTASASSSSSANIVAEHSDHYDTPWEFKNRALAAALGRQRLEQRQKEVVESQKKKNGGEEKQGQQAGQNKMRDIHGTAAVNNGGPGTNVSLSSNGGGIVRKRLSLPAQQRRKDGSKGAEGEEGAINSQMSCSISSDVQLEQQQQQQRTNGHGQRRNVADAKEANLPLQADPRPPPTSSRTRPTVDRPPPPLPAHQNVPMPIHCRAHSSPSNTSSSASAACQSPSPCSAVLPMPPSSNSSSSGSTANSQRGEGGRMLFGMNGHGRQQQRQRAAQQHGRAQMGQHQHGQAVTATPPPSLRSYPLVSMNSGPSTKELLAFCREEEAVEGHNNKLEQEEQLSELVHERMERAEAELLLGGLPLGTHLLRRRPDASLALSLKGTEGVLHIKLELRQPGAHWVLGEGPRFRSVHSMLRAYHRSELPVRGAEQIRLGPLLRPEDVNGRGLLLL